MLELTDLEFDLMCALADANGALNSGDLTDAVCDYHTLEPDAILSVQTTLKKMCERNFCCADDSEFIISEVGRSYLESSPPVPVA